MRTSISHSFREWSHEQEYILLLASSPHTCSPLTDCVWALRVKADFNSLSKGDMWHGAFRGIWRDCCVYYTMNSSHVIDVNQSGWHRCYYCIFLLKDAFKLQNSEHSKSVRVRVKVCKREREGVRACDADTIYIYIERERERISLRRGVFSPNPTCSVWRLEITYNVRT